MSYLIESFENVALTDEKEEFGIRVGADFIIVPVGLSREENGRFMEEVREKGYLVRKVDNHLARSYERSSIMACLGEELKKQIRKRRVVGLVKEDDSDSKTWRVVPRVFLERVGEGIKITEHSGGLETVNWLLWETVLGQKLGEYWVEKEGVDGEVVEERMRYITRGETLARLVEETNFEAGVQAGVEGYGMQEVKTRGEIEVAFKEMDQELPVKIGLLSPKRQLRVKKQLEFLMWKELSAYGVLDLEGLEGVRQKVLYLEKFCVDTSLVREKVRASLKRLRRRARKLEEGFV